eukprot:6764404-Karenia_brevis.AAC.1
MYFTLYSSTNTSANMRYRVMYCIGIIKKWEWKDVTRSTHDNTTKTGQTLQLCKKSAAAQACAGHTRDREPLDPQSFFRFFRAKARSSRAFRCSFITELSFFTSSASHSCNTGATQMPALVFVVPMNK